MNLRKSALLILGALPVLATSIAPAVAQQNSVVMSEPVSITVISEQEFSRWDKYATQELASRVSHMCEPWPLCC